jgi:hypothetical protein
VAATKEGIQAQDGGVDPLSPAGPPPPAIDSKAEVLMDVTTSPDVVNGAPEDGACHLRLRRLQKTMNEVADVIKKCKHHRRTMRDESEVRDEGEMKRDCRHIQITADF